ncbi:MAG: hypothetical protein L6306_06775 [Planctomycetales bacterium]|nr:hypothetical protein [Planctomycetales bacterium]
MLRLPIGDILGQGRLLLLRRFLDSRLLHRFLLGRRGLSHSRRRLWILLLRRGGRRRLGVRLHGGNRRFRLT